MMHNSDDDWLRLACANALLDRGHGKPREVAIFEQQEAFSTPYPTIAEFKAELKRRGLPIDRLEDPKLIDHKPIDQ
jgi:hypothetical protein